MKRVPKSLIPAIFLGAFTSTLVHAAAETTAMDNSMGHLAAAQSAIKKPIAGPMPSSIAYTGLSRKVLEYSEGFTRVVNKIKQPNFSDTDWQPLEQLVDTENFERVGVFLSDKAEVLNWPQYKHYISLYGAATSWEGALRRITEVPGLVILELEERNTINGKTDISNTVTIYEFNEAGKLTHLDVYVMPLP